MARALDAVCALALVAFLVWSIAGEAVRTGGLGDDALDDYAIARARSAEILARGDYAWQLEGDGRAVVFAYPPPGVVLYAGLAAAGRRAGPLLFMVALGAACVGGVWAAQRLLGLRTHRPRWLPVLLAVGACRVFVQADLHFLNSNLLSAALAVGALAAWGPRPGAPRAEALGGLLLAASLALKPWAVAIGAMGLAGRRTGALTWTAVAGVGLFAVLPACVVGPRGAVALTVSWLAFLPETLRAGAASRIAVDDVSLVAAAGAIGLGEGASVVLARALQAVWVLGAAALVMWSLVPGTTRSLGDGRAWLRTGGTLLVLLVPLTGMAQIHHLAVAVPLGLVVASDALAGGAPLAGRLGRLALLAGVFGLSSYGPGGAARGLSGLACLVGLVAAAWWPRGSERSRAGDAFGLPEAPRSL